MNIHQVTKDIVTNYPISLKSAMPFVNTVVYELFGGDHKRDFSKEDETAIIDFVLKRSYISHAEPCSVPQSAIAKPDNAFRQRKIIRENNLSNLIMRARAFLAGRL